MLLLLASQQTVLNALVIVLVFGVLVATFGHIVRSRTLILTGLLIIGGVSVYFLLGVAAVN